MHHAGLIDTKSVNAIEFYEQALRDFIVTDDDDLRSHICIENVIICRRHPLYYYSNDMLMDRNDYDKMVAYLPYLQ